MYTCFALLCTDHKQTNYQRITKPITIFITLIKNLLLGKLGIGLFSRKKMTSEWSNIYRTISDKKNHSTPAGVVPKSIKYSFYRHLNPLDLFLILFPLSLELFALSPIRMKKGPFK